MVVPRSTTIANLHDLRLQFATRSTFIHSPPTQVVGRTNNNGCVGKKIYLDPREPKDPDPSSAVRFLTYMPSMVMVQPNNAPKP